MHDKTQADERQAELSQVRHAHAMIPHAPAPPPVPDMLALDAEHHADPPDPLRTLLHAVSTCWYLWGGRP